MRTNRIFMGQENGQRHVLKYHCSLLEHIWNQSDLGYHRGCASHALVMDPSDAKAKEISYFSGVWHGYHVRLASPFSRPLKSDFIVESKDLHCFSISYLRYYTP